MYFFRVGSYQVETRTGMRAVAWFFKDGPCKLEFNPNLTSQQVNELIQLWCWQTSCNVFHVTWSGLNLGDFDFYQWKYECTGIDTATFTRPADWNEQYYELDAFLHSYPGNSFANSVYKGNN